MRTLAFDEALAHYERVVDLSGRADDLPGPAVPPAVGRRGGRAPGRRRRPCRRPDATGHRLRGPRATPSPRLSARAAGALPLDGGRGRAVAARRTGGPSNSSRPIRSPRWQAAVVSGHAQLLMLTGRFDEARDRGRTGHRAGRPGARRQADRGARAQRPGRRPGAPGRGGARDRGAARGRRDRPGGVRRRRRHRPGRREPDTPCCSTPDGSPRRWRWPSTASRPSTNWACSAARASGAAATRSTPSSSSGRTDEAEVLLREAAPCTPRASTPCGCTACAGPSRSAAGGSRRHGGELEPARRLGRSVVDGHLILPIHRALLETLRWLGEWSAAVRRDRGGARRRVVGRRRRLPGPRARRSGRRRRRRRGRRPRGPADRRGTPLDRARRGARRRARSRDVAAGPPAPPGPGGARRRPGRARRARRARVRRRPGRTSPARGSELGDVYQAGVRAPPAGGVPARRPAAGRGRRHPRAAAPGGDRRARHAPAAGRRGDRRPGPSPPGGARAPDVAPTGSA